MHVSRALLKNTRASLHFHRRFFIFLVALLIVIVALVAVYSGLPQIVTAGNTDTGSGTSGFASGAYIFETFTDEGHNPTPTPSTSVSPTPVITFPPLTDTPEYGVGGAVIALFVAFVAFTLFVKHTKKAPQAT